MAHSTLDPSADRVPDTGKGRDVGSLGPSDSSDSGSDMQNISRKPQDIEDELDQHALPLGPEELQGDSDRFGTGERASADGDSNLTPDADIQADHEIEVEPDQAGTEQGTEKNPAAPRRQP